VLVLYWRRLQHRAWLALLLPVILASCAQEPQVAFLGNEAYFDALMPHLTRAKQEIVVSMFLFATGDRENNRANQVKEALIEAAKRGVRVHVFLDQSDAQEFSTEANRNVAEDMRRHGITVKFDSPARTTHTKLVIIDQRYVFLGSHNFTQSALRHNNEASVFVESPKIAQQALAYLKRIEELSAKERTSGLEGRRPYARHSE
jgi:phosphatidylserine/phosphatidylglycerophosphate/cardiolipin synthase-like enzyme